MAIQILEQKAICQQDPDQDEDDEAPEYQAEYDSVLISSAGDLVAALANALGVEFVPAFNTFYPLIAKYYVCVLSCSLYCSVLTINCRGRTALSVIARRPSAASLKSFPASRMVSRSTPQPSLNSSRRH